MKLKKGEKIEDLQNGFSIIQNPQFFSFGTDAVLLAHFADITKGERVIDFCTGCAIIPILLCAKKKGARILGIEIQEQIADIAKRSIELNSLEEQIDIVHGDIKNILDIAEYGADAVVVNPPYEKAGSGKHNENEFVNIAKKEIMCELRDVISSAAKILRTGGRLYMIYRTERFPELMQCMREYKIEPKRMRMVAQRSGKAPNFVLVEARKGARQGASFLPELVVYEKDGEYTKELKEIYNIKEQV